MTIGQHRITKNPQLHTSTCLSADLKLISFRRGRELDIYSRFSGSSYCSLSRLIQDYKNGTGEFYDDGEGRKMKKLKYTNKI